MKMIELKASNTNTPKNILIIGVFHGDEPQGFHLINKFLEDYKNKPVKNNLFLLPCLNEYGFKTNLRTNSNAVDLNRNFPTKNWAETEKNEFYSGKSPASEDETMFLVDFLTEHKIDCILTLHAPFKIVNFDGPAEELALDIGKLMNYPVQEDIGYPTFGSFGTYCGIERNIPTITLELDESESIEKLYPKVFKVLEYLAQRTQQSVRP